ncbi:MAG: Rho termination factor N-terminal domain-containing protein [Clostridia bacterium]|nr:Rho termination factor N-terminal domain-containing protein [Clostridia bacterium]
MQKQSNKIFDKDLVNEKTLAPLTIKELRGLGWSLGVSSPTSLKKDDLIEAILKVLYGKSNIVRQSSVGRPSNQEVDIDGIMKKLGKNKEKEDFIQEFGKGLFNLNSTKLSSPTEEYLSNEKIDIRTLVKQDNKCYLRKYEFIESNDDIELTQKQVERLGLDEKDVVEVVITDGAFKVLSINGKLLKNNFESLKIENENIKRGKTNPFYLRTKDEINKEIKNLIEKAQSQNLEIAIYANSDFAYENAKCVVYDENEKNVYKKIISFVNICEKAIFESRDLLIVFDDFKNFKNQIDGLESGIKERLVKYLSSVKEKSLKLGNAIVEFLILEEVTY